MTGNAKGEATLTIDDANVATFQLRETVHTFTAKTPNGGKGSDSNAPLASSTLVWQPGGTCP